MTDTKLYNTYPTIESREPIFLAIANAIGAIQEQFNIAPDILIALVYNCNTMLAANNGVTPKECEKLVKFAIQQAKRARQADIAAGIKPGTTH